MCQTFRLCQAASAFPYDFSWFFSLFRSIPSFILRLHRPHTPEGIYLLLWQVGCDTPELHFSDAETSRKFNHFPGVGPFLFGFYPDFMLLRIRKKEKKREEKWYFALRQVELTQAIHWEDLGIWWWTSYYLLRAHVVSRRGLVSQVCNRAIFINGIHLYLPAKTQE